MNTPMLFALAFGFLFVGNAEVHCPAYDDIALDELPKRECFRCQDGATRQLEYSFANDTTFGLPPCSEEPIQSEMALCPGACLYVEVERQGTPYRFGRLRECVEYRKPGRLFAYRIRAKGVTNFHIGDYAVRMHFCTEPGCNMYLNMSSYPNSMFKPDLATVLGAR